MSIMFRNSNAALEKELAAEDYRAHSVRNRLGILAVALTAILLIITFTMGINFATAASRAMGAAPGPGAGGAFILGDEQTLERVRALPQVEWAAYARRCSKTYLHNSEFYALTVYLFAADAVHYDKNMVDLIVGKYPEKADEIILSDTMSERLGLEERVGVSFTLKAVVQKDGEELEQEIPMTVCGYYNNPLRSSADLYEEIYTSEAFIATYNPELPEGYDTIYVKLNNLNPFMFGHDIGARLLEVYELSEGNSWGYRPSDMTLLIIIPVLLIVACVMLCGYFFIYNIFDISVVNDIRFYGELKTIGMTSRQLRRMLLWQMNRIAFIGIVLGGLIGCIVGQTAAEKIVCTFAENIASFYKPSGFGETLLLGAGFAWLTVWISTMKPFRIACTISPVEAARYRAKGKKRALSVLSFALSGILFLVVYTVAIGFSPEIQTQRRTMTDFQIRHRGIIWDQTEPFSPISQELVQKLKNLEFAKDFRICYIARTKPDYVFERGTQWYFTSGEIAADGEVAKDRMAYAAKAAEETGYSLFDQRSGRGNLLIRVAGLDPAYLDDEAERYTVLEGGLDAEKFADGSYLIYNREVNLSETSGSGGMDYQIHAGDEVTVNFYDDAAQRYVEKKLRVMAIVMNNDIYDVSNLFQENIWVTNETFRSIYSDYENLVGAVCFNAAGQTQGGEALSEEERQKRVEEVLEEDGNVQLMLDSEYELWLYFTEMKRTITVFGILLAAIVGLIGIANMVNTVTTDVMARRVEYAAMQSIGMTGRQMQRDIFMKYARYVFTALGIATVAGGVFSCLAGANPILNFSLAAFVQAFVIFLLFSILLCVVMARFLVKNMSKKSVVERLREIV